MVRSIGALAGAAAALAGLAEARSLWSTRPATHGSRGSHDDGYVLKTAYLLGNGRLGAMPFGPPGAERLVFNVDSLWSGGPFQSADYRGGNPVASKADALPAIRDQIWKNGTGDLSPLLGSSANYGSYRVLGNFTVDIAGVADAPYTDYRRSLDLTTGVHTTTFKTGNSSFSTWVYCGFPDQVCVYTVAVTGDRPAALPDVSVRFDNALVPAETFTRSCGDAFTRVRGVTQVGPPEGLRYDAMARVVSSGGGGGGGGSAASTTTRCGDDGTLVISTPEGQRSVSVVIGAGTDFDQTKGNAASGYSFRGDDPAPLVEATTAAAAAKTQAELLKAHLDDYAALMGGFQLDIADAKGSAAVETGKLIASYRADDVTGDPYLEAALFDYSRHLAVSSSRANSLPTNLAGRWTEELEPAWSADHHANINLQMNYWVNDQTGLGPATTPALWDYMELNWAPRGAETARLLYGADAGWVVHNEMNVFGFSAMKEEASWANYPAANAWMMQHVWDRWEYGLDAAWFRRQGYPLIKGTAQFWLSQLQEDKWFNDGSLVVNPCNSPEHGPTTFGCTHFHQEIHRTLFTALAGAEAGGETDAAFLGSVRAALARLDKGVHRSDFGGLKEWKLPDSYGLPESSNHRHLSHLVGWHPGYSVSGLLGGYANATVQAMVEASLRNRRTPHQGGWSKVVRAAHWARLNNTAEAHGYLRSAIDSNFVANGLSMYSGLEEPFQIDANFGLGGAILAMLNVDLPAPECAGRDHVRSVVLGNAIPAAWGAGRVKGLRIRGGGSVNFEWDSNGLVTRATLSDSKTKVRLVNMKGDVLAESE
ncbi:hypothetical protein RB598_000095 [Gaeumannomyces tritici]